jgi:hypothetical protein
LLGVHSRYGLHTRAVTVYRDTLSEGFSHFVTSIAAPVASGWSVSPGELAPTGKRHLFTAHVNIRHWDRQVGDTHIVVGTEKYWCWSGSSRHPISASRQPRRELGEVVDLAIDRDRAAVLLSHNLVAY